MKQKFIEWFTKGNNGCAPSINADGSFEHEKTQHMFEAYQAGMAESDRKVEQLAAELSAVDAIHNDAVFITDDHYEQCPPEVQKMIRSLAVLQIPAYKAFLAEVRASAITDALKSLDGVFDTDCVMESNGISYEDAEQRTAGAYAVSKSLEDFAAQLRKGVQS